MPNCRVLPSGKLKSTIPMPIYPERFITTVAMVSKTVAMLTNITTNTATITTTNSGDQKQSSPPLPAVAGAR